MFVGLLLIAACVLDIERKSDRKYLSDNDEDLSAFEEDDGHGGENISAQFLGLAYSKFPQST